MKQTNRHQVNWRRIADVILLSCCVAGALQAQTILRVNAGGASSTFTGTDGQQWLTDRYYTPSDTLYTRDAIGNTADQYLYRTARAGLYSDFEYNIPVPNGSYNLTLKFAEIKYFNRGDRVFHVTVNGKRVLANFDIMAEVPARTALDKTFPVTVTGGAIRVQFQGVKNRGIVNAIRVDASSAQPVTISVNPTQISLAQGQTAQFAAQVGGTTNTAVSWKASAGTISPSGLYTAPSSITEAAAVTVTATCAVNPQVTAAAVVNLKTPVKVSVSPATGSVNAGLTLQLTSAVTGSSDTRVTWTASAGKIDGNGLFTAPAVSTSTVVSIKATSVADGSASGSAQITVNPAGASGAPVWADGAGLISMEAEHGTIVNRAGITWSPSSSSSNFSGSAFLLPSPTSGKLWDANYVGNAPEVQFKVDFKTTGTYYVWLRGAGMTAHVGLDGAASATGSHISGLTTEWGWTNARMDGSRAAINVGSAGVHTVNVWMRDDALWFDKIVLVQWSGYTVADNGPDETPFSGGAPDAPTTPTSPTNPTTPTTPTSPAAGMVTTPGRVALMKMSGPPNDSNILTTSGSLQQFQVQKLARMTVFSPVFDGPSQWYGNGLVYADSYAIYPGGTFGENVVATHPEWILKDQAGRNLYIPWGCGGGTCPQYAADFSNPAYRQWWITKVKGVLARGNYKGVFIDDVNFDWRVSDNWGNTVTPWDRNTNALMTIANWRRYFAEFLEAVRAGLPGYEICHNSIWYAGGDNGRDSDPYIARQIAAADNLFIEFGINDGGLTGGTGLWSVDAVLSYAERVAAQGKRPVIGNIAGGSSTDRAGLEFAIAGVLLVNNGNVMAADAYSSMAIDPNNWWPGYDVDLGTPAGKRYTWNGVMRRDFSNGMVLLNDPGAGTQTLALPGPFKKVNGTTVTSVTLGPRQAVILVK